MYFPWSCPSLADRVTGACFPRDWTLCGGLPLEISRDSLLQVSYTAAFTEGEDGTEVYTVLLIEISVPLLFCHYSFKGADSP